MGRPVRYGSQVSYRLDEGNLYQINLNRSFLIAVSIARRTQRPRATNRVNLVLLTTVLYRSVGAWQPERCVSKGIPPVVGDGFRRILPKSHASRTLRSGWGNHIYREIELVGPCFLKSTVSGQVHE